MARWKRRAASGTHGHAASTASEAGCFVWFSPFCKYSGFCNPIIATSASSYRRDVHKQRRLSFRDIANKIASEQNLTLGTGQGDCRKRPQPDAARGGFATTKPVAAAVHQAQKCAIQRTQASVSTGLRSIIRLLDHPEEFEVHRRCTATVLRAVGKSGPSLRL